MLSGYKTYIMSALIAVATFVYYMQWVDLNTYTLILGILGAGSVASIRASIK